MTEVVHITNEASDLSSNDIDSELDKIFNLIGENGRYQKLLLWGFLVPYTAIIPWTALVQVFQVSVPNHWCHVPGQTENVSDQMWKNMTIPWENKEGKYVQSNCEYYSTPPELDTISNCSIPVRACDKGWEFDHTWYDRTLPMSQNWVCDRDSYAARWLAAGVAGNVVGTLIFTYISDLLGRKVSIILTAIIYSVFGISRLFVKSDIGLLSMMFLSSTSFPANLEITVIYVMEQVSGDMRSQVTSLSFIMWTVGMCLIPLLAWLTRDWLLLGIITSLPFIPFFIIWWIFPESPRWLLTRSRVKDSLKAFQRIAKSNGTHCPEGLERVLEKIVQNKKAQEREKTSFCSDLSFIKFFKYQTLRKRLLLLTLCYICNNTIYYGIIYNISNISGNEFLNFFYVSISELPGNFLGWFCSQVFGRRWSAVGILLLTSLTAVVAVVIANIDSWVQVFVLVTCKTLVNISFLIVYIQLAELLPTSHRAAGIGFASVVSSILGISSPYIAYSGTYWPALPYMILATIGLCGTICALFLPETLGETLPQTMQDAEHFLTDQSFWHYGGWRPGKKKKTMKN